MQTQKKNKKTRNTYCVIFVEHITSSGSLRRPGTCDHLWHLISLCRTYTNLDTLTTGPVDTNKVILTHMSLNILQQRHWIM